MHELAVTQHILDIALEHAQQAGAQRIMAIYLVIGDIASIVDDSVQLYFDYLTPETMAEGAKLVFRRIPARYRCRACGHEYTPEHGWAWQCPVCQEWGGEVLQGQEFSVESIEVE